MTQRAWRARPRTRPEPSRPKKPPANPEASSWIADLDRPAVGVPRRFGVFIMMLMVTLYAVLFSMMKLLRATNLVFVLLALLFTGHWHRPGSFVRRTIPASGLDLDRLDPCAD